MGWNIEVEADKIKNGGKFGAKRVREDVFRNNREVFLRWAVPTADGREISLGDKSAFLAGTKVFASEQKPADEALVVCERTETGVVNADCVLVAEAMGRLGLKPAILNLASRFSPGGGYHDGTSAQEESLCQVSTLSQSLYQYGDAKYKHIRESGVPHRFVAYPLHQRFGGIYTPDVTFFRHGIRAVYAIREPEAWFRCGVITVPALSFRETNKYNNAELEFRAPDGGFTAGGESVMKDKIRTIYRAALHSGHDALVLGAFGCGVFQLRPDRVAELFDTVLHEPEFDCKFKSVVFAILEGRGKAHHPVGEAGKFAPFYERFGRCQIGHGIDSQTGM